MFPPVSARKLRDAMPIFLSDQAQALPATLSMRCGIVNYLLNGEEGTLEDRIYELVAEMPIEIGEDKQVA